MEQALMPAPLLLSGKLLGHIQLATWCVSVKLFTALSDFLYIPQCGGTQTNFGFVIDK
jgi:hypothetical protein